MLSFSAEVSASVGENSGVLGGPVAMWLDGVAYIQPTDPWYELMW